MAEPKLTQYHQTGADPRLKVFAFFDLATQFTYLDAAVNATVASMPLERDYGVPFLHPDDTTTLGVTNPLVTGVYSYGLTVSNHHRLCRGTSS